MIYKVILNFIGLYLKTEINEALVTILSITAALIYQRPSCGFPSCVIVLSIGTRKLRTHYAENPLNMGLFMIFPCLGDI